MKKPERKMKEISTADFTNDNSGSKSAVDRLNPEILYGDFCLFVYLFICLFVYLFISLFPINVRSDARALLCAY
jgi:hypothetical protein